MGKSNKIVTIGQGPGALNVVLVAGTANTLSLRRTGLDDLPEAWPSAPVLNLRNNVHAISYTAAATLSDNGTVATWVIPALNSPPPTDPNRPTESQLVLDGIPIYAGSVRCLDPWQDSAYSPATRDISVIAGPPGANGTPGADGPPGPAGRNATALPDRLDQLFWPEASETGYFLWSLGGAWTVQNNHMGSIEITPVPNSENAMFLFVLNGTTFIVEPVGELGEVGIRAVGSDVVWNLGVLALTLVNSGIFVSANWDFETNVFGNFRWTDGSSAPLAVTGTQPTEIVKFIMGSVGPKIFVDATENWSWVDSNGVWVTTTPPVGVTSETSAPVGWDSGVLGWDGSTWHYCDPDGTWTTVTGGPTNPSAFNIFTETLAGVTVESSTPGEYELHTWNPDTGWNQPALGTFTSISPLSDGWVYNWQGTQWRSQSVNMGGYYSPNVPAGFTIKHATGRIVNVLYISTDDTWVLDNSGFADVIPTSTSLKCIENRLTALENP